MDRRSSSPARPRSLRLGSADTTWKSTSLSPASEGENRQWADDLEKYDEMTEYMKEVDEILDFIQPFPRGIPAEKEAEPAKERLNHLENLVRLVEQLKELKEKNSESQQRTKQLKDLRTMRERRRKGGVGDTTFDIPPPPPDPPKKHRPLLPFRKSTRSKSLSAQEYFATGRFTFPRKSVSSGKVSKWTKVKEAFRWEKTSQLETRLKQGKVDRKEVAFFEECKSAGNEEASTLAQHRLQVPDKLADSPSPADSVLSGHISSCSSLGAASSSCLLASSGYSGEHSSGAHSHSSVHVLDLPSPIPLVHTDHRTQSLQELDSSSEDEEHDKRGKFSPMGSGDLTNRTNRSIHEEIETKRSKSLDGENILDPASHLLHLSKESLQDESKTPKHKTPWGKVIDIIQTRKDSLKKRPNKREKLKIETEPGRFIAAMEPDWTSSTEFHGGYEASSPEDQPEDMRPKIEVTYEKAPQVFQLMPRRLDVSTMRPLTPVLTLTRPSTEELQNSFEAEETTTTGRQIATPNPKVPSMSSEHPPTDEKVKALGFPAQGRSSRWGRVKKAFLTSASGDELPPCPSSVPSSPIYLCSFFSDNESDELSSGEWAEERQDKPSDTPNSPDLTTTFIQAEVQRNYAHLENSLSHEIEANTRARELVKSLTKCDDQAELGDDIPKKPRESITIPLPTLDDLSPEFKKKLDEWKKIKKIPATPTSVKEEPQGHFITKIGEWQRWRPGSSSHPKTDTTHHLKHEHHLQEEFYKKLEDWQMLRSSKRSRSHSDRGKDDRDYQTPSPGLSRKNSKGATKKTTSGKSSGSESLSGSLKEREGRAGRKSQKEKDLQWLEKELNKIEREKLRLEREREKYLEREARLEQMKRTMDTTTPSQEVLIQTATGFFRFEGISQKFTKKLYEWEKARGIAPEASTFALLETASVACRSREERGGLQRSKSVGSVIDSASAAALSVAHHPSSLSLNDKDDLEAMERASLLDAARRSSEYDLECEGKEDEEEEPEALIVDVEVVVEETAAMMADQPCVLGEVPVYSYAPAEVTHLIDSSGSDNEREVYVLQAKNEQRKSSEEKVLLIDQNMDLLDKLEVKEAICRDIENDLDDIEGRISNQEHPASPPKQTLLLEGENLKHSFLEHSGKQQALVHDLVDNMRLLYAANSSTSPENATCDISQVLELSSQLLSLAQKLEETLCERNADINKHRRNLRNRRDRLRVNRIGSEKVWFSTDEEGTTNTLSLGGEDPPDVGDLPLMITRKVLELKSGLSRLKESTVTQEQELAVPVKRSEKERDHDVTSYTVPAPTTGRKPSLVSPTEFQLRTSEKRPSLIITTRQNSPPCENLSPVTVTVSPPFWGKTKPDSDVLQKGLQKSKTQMIGIENAEKCFEKHASEPSKQDKSPEVLKKRIKEKILEMHRMSSEVRPRIPPAELNTGTEETLESDDDCVQEKNEESKIVIVRKNGKGARATKMLKARRITDTTIAYKSGSESNPKNEGSDDVFVMQKRGFSHVFSASESCASSGLSGTTPTFVFVPTTRKIISPVQTDTASSVLSYVIDDIEPPSDQTPSAIQHCASSSEQEEIYKVKASVQEPDAKPIEALERTKLQRFAGQAASDIGMPPLPNSPSASRKLVKEASPSIRMMIAKYNQKITEQQPEITEASSGTLSPVIWRSPVLDRRIKDQMNRFEKDGMNPLKHGGKFGRGEVQKSASAGLITSDMSSSTCSSTSQDKKKEDGRKGVLKSLSAGSMRPPTSLKSAQNSDGVKVLQETNPEFKKPEVEAPLALRALKIKQAKAEFLSKGLGGQSGDASPTPTSISSGFSWRTPTERQESLKEEIKLRNRLSHVSIGSESSFDELSYGEELPNLMKSASAGMIITAQGEPARRRSDGSVEQPCIRKMLLSSTNIPAMDPSVKRSSKFCISNIKSRFRRVKMRKTKEKESAVSTLCRQSLLLDVSHAAAERAPQHGNFSKSCPSSPIMERSGARQEDGRRWVPNPAKLLFKSKESKRLSTESASGDKR